jgi:hypothetical protein
MGMQIDVLPTVAPRAVLAKAKAAAAKAAAKAAAAVSKD